MKKIILLAVLITAHTFANATQPVTKAAKKQVAPAPTPTVVAVDTNKADIDSAALLLYLTHVNAWLTTCGAEGRLLYEQGRAIGANVKDAFKDLPLPNTTEGLTAWVGELTKIFDSVLAAFAVGSPLAMLLTWLLSLVKKNPSETVNKIRLIANQVRTRFFIFGSSLIVTVIAAIHFNDGGFGLKDLFTSLATFFSVTIGQMGFQNFLAMIGIKWFEAKKV